MLTFFCPGCRAESRVEHQVCPQCGLSLEDARRDYVGKLIGLSLEHPVPSVPPVAADILGRIGDRRAVEPLCRVLMRTRDGALQQVAARALGALGDPAAVPALVYCLRRGRLAARVQAASSLAALGGPEARAALETAAAGDPSAAVRAAARESLRQMALSDGREDLP